VERLFAAFFDPEFLEKLLIEFGKLTLVYL
jgi:hypothetical protein